MKLGAFVMPSHPPERPLLDGYRWDLFVGSPQTVVDKIAALQRHTGGFGGLLIMLYDFSSEPGWWSESLQRLVEEVMPHFQGAQRAG